jgi:hypothetical protein
MAKFKIRVRLRGTLKTRSDEREFQRLLEKELNERVEALTGQFDGDLRIQSVEVGRIQPDGERDD